MSLSGYHQKYADLSDEEIRKRVRAKDNELQKIFQEIQIKTNSEIVRVAVLGCADKRLIRAHQELFEKYLNKPVKLFTFDITTEHLAGEENVIQHDCTKLLPGAPYDITYAHVLLKFIETQKQWDLLMNSYTALKPRGIALHVLDAEDYKSDKVQLADGSYVVPLEQWKKKLGKENISVKEIPVQYGLALILLKS